MYPTLKGKSTVKQVTDTFYGYNHNLKIGDGEFYECENMTTDYYPLAACSRKHFKYLTFNGTIYGAIKSNNSFGDEESYFVGKANGSDKTYLRTDTGFVVNEKLELTEGEKQLVNMGAYICIFPDGAYYNTQDGTDCGYMGCTWQYECSATNTFSFNLCNSDFEDYKNVDNTGYGVGEYPPDPTDGYLFFHSIKEEATKAYISILEKYDAKEKTWNSVTYYVKYKFKTQGEIPQNFKVGEIVDLTFPGGVGIYDYETGNIKKEKRTFTLLDVGGKAATDSAEGEDDYIVVKNEYIEISDRTYSAEFVAKIYRGIPIMDYVVECQNRLWGCRYGGQYDANKVYVAHVNELYACELGNFRNWYKYEGISTDSWAASIGSGGEWTGAITFNGNPLFFKQDCVHQVTVSSQGAHRVTQISVQGVRSGSSKSLCIIQNKLYYHSTTGVLEYQGGLTGKISSALGDGYFIDAVSAAKNNKLYIAMYDMDGDHYQHLYVYDTLKGLWSKQKTPADIKYMASFIGENEERICAFSSSTLHLLDGVSYAAVDSWSFESGIFTYNSGSKYKSSYNGGHRYITRFDIRLKMELGAECEMYIEYDSSGTWEFAGRIKVRNTDSFMIPIRPRRCDHLRIKLKGSGDVKIYSITRNLAMGSDNP